MIYKNDVALKMAGYLLETKAVKLSPKDLFTWASGIKSPIYCDNRITLSFPDIRKYIRDRFADIIKNNFKPDVIAGVATGGIAQGALVADVLELPFAYVRTSRKDHGLTNMIEGKIEPGQKVVVVEDLISTGKSSLEVVAALREAGCEIEGMVAIFTYNIPAATKAFENANCKLITLSDYDILAEQAVATHYITPDDLEVLTAFKAQLANK